LAKAGGVRSLTFGQRLSRRAAIRSLRHPLSGRATDSHPDNALRLRDRRALWSTPIGVSVLGRWLIFQRGGHVQGLVRTCVVVIVVPFINGLLGGFEIGERCMRATEFSSQAAVESLDLAGRGRAARSSQQMLDAGDLRQRQSHRALPPKGLASLAMRH
jgi:hypothetical protein